MRTAINSFGLLREYPHRPSFEPDLSVPTKDLSVSSRLPAKDQEDLSPEDPSPGSPHPFPNMTIYRLIQWMNSGSKQKSEGEITRLVKDVLLAEDFNVADLKGFSSKKYLKLLDSHKRDTSHPNATSFPDDWKEETVTIQIPTRDKDPSGMGKTYSVPGFHFRPLVGVIRAAFAEAQAKAFHLSPFKRFWTSSVDGTEQRVYDELYTSDAWLEAHNELQKQPFQPGCKLERVIAGLMLFSDATHLADFGTAKAWPLYLYFGNLSKYVRASPTSGACHLVGFLPLLPDSVQEVISTLNKMSRKAISALNAHCRRELFHACWNTLMDDEFLEAYRHGIVVRCADGILRRIFPRLFTYSADYPEKILLATVKDLGRCPCPRCYTLKSLADNVGLLRDMRSRLTQCRQYSLEKIRRARDFIYKSGFALDGPAIDRVLKPESWVPTINAFAQKLGPLGLDPFRMLVVDFMHECELGTWKALFTHLIRLLYALPQGEQHVAELNRRFRLIPTYGRGVIRRFSNNTSQMKRLAARDFEDILQCAMPTFEGLFPRTHNEIILTLLYRFAEWHAYAKLRLHTDSTLDLMSDTFTALTKQLRLFRKKTCGDFHTVELPKEKDARARRKKGKKASTGESAPRLKQFNLRTYKFHALGDYVRTIRLFGTTDSYTTQIGELAHRAIKAFYSLTNKNNTNKDLAKHEHRRRRLRRMRESSALDNRPSPENDLPPPDPCLHHQISKTRNDPKDIFKMLQLHKEDPAGERFIPKLKDHILYRLQGLDFNGDEYDFTDAQRNSIVIPNNILFESKTLRVNYTTYDLRREEDSINSRNHNGVMVLSREADVPYWYAKILNVFHVDVLHIDPESGEPSRHYLDILWVRWFGEMPGYRSGTKAARLPKIGFVPAEDSLAFGFLDPALVIRGCHLIPCFADGRTAELLRYGTSAGRMADEVDDWVAYYVNIFVDRDMFMRYVHGGGVGHRHQSPENTDDAADITQDDHDSDEEKMEHDDEDIDVVGGLGDGDRDDASNRSDDESDDGEDGSEDDEDDDDDEDEDEDEDEDDEDEDDEDEDEDDEDENNEFSF
ncbi:hypothetical protein BV22DRAFT_1020666 [Leucogyrophana mollusca]|uniref:Uncharacterized protein n=1 Tax=Leucogyrophana mollusca TaxID=85980 RepID=A0ACB8B791_9AGAM|nr:hypothetical protein BV22DRAFT_1020666 [Leucogyrophana mollusca]